MNKIVTFFIALCAYVNWAQAQINNLDSSALVDFYYAAGGSNWTNHTNWLTKAPVSTWYGVTVKYIRNRDRVTGLDLPGNNLTGSIAPRIGYLLELEMLDISHNKLGGEFKFVNNFIKLRVLNISNNEFTGTPFIYFKPITALQILDLSSNKFTGNIPGGLDSLTVLTVLKLNNNEFDGNIPALDSMSLLEELDFSSNKLTGNIPPALGRITSLKKLYFNNNHLTGQIPEELGYLVNLEILTFNVNGLTGQIPSTFSNLINLRRLSFKANFLIGPLPSFLTTLPSLKFLDILNNKFTFSGMEALVQHNFTTLNYNRQKLIPIKNDNTNTLSVNAGGTKANNTYKWYKDGQLVATKVGISTFKYTQGGKYFVKVTNSIATELTLTSRELEVNTINLKENNNLVAATGLTAIKYFSVYPNPAKTTVTVSFNIYSNATLKVRTLSGKIIETRAASNLDGIHALQLDVSKYASGLYIVSLTNSGHETQTLMLIKQ